jgi:predicted DNA binding CopG/RHH family protein
MEKGFTSKPNDPSVIQAIIDRAAQKATQAISIRISVADLEAAKRIAEKTGLAYQTVLKDIIHEGLQRAS